MPFIRSRTNMRHLVPDHHSTGFLVLTEACNLGALLDPNADPEKIALIDLRLEDSPRQSTHGEIDREADAVARGLVARGYRRGDRIAILAANRTEYLTAYFGTMRAGMVSVPVNFKFPKETIDYILRDSGAKLVFCDAERRAMCPDGIPVVDFDEEGAEGFAGFLDPGAFETVRPAADEVAMFLYTSGSTGKPKGVPLTHAGHLWVLRRRAELAPPGYSDQRLLVAAPLYHMNALATAKFVVSAHASMILLPQFRAPAYIGAIGRFRATWLTSVPTMLALVAQERELLAKTDLSSVGIVAMGSAPVTTTLLDRLGEIFPGARIVHSYGTTEAGPIVFGAHPEGLAKPQLSLGVPVPDIGFRLVDASGREVDEGVVELKTPANMPGYHNLPEKTAQALTPDGWYHTGDVMRRDENGFIYFVGREDDMFVCGGENIYPGEVEGMLERHPDIVQAAVVPVPDEIRGQKPVAFVVRRPGAKLTADGVKQYALANAPAYQHPRQVTFVETLPLASTNKIDRKTLTEEAARLAG